MRSKHARAFTRLVNVGMGCRTGDVLELSDTWISGSMGMVEIVTTYLKMRDDLFTSKYERICMKLMILEDGYGKKLVKLTLLARGLQIF